MSGILEVIYEDSNVLMVNKLAAVPVLPDKSGDNSIKDFLHAMRPGHFFEAAHRLDRRTSGIVAFGKTKHGVAELSEAFREHRTQKTYWAAVENKPSSMSGTLAHKLLHDGRKNVTHAVRATKNDKGDIAELAWELIGESDRYFLLAVRPLQGKTHQIRAQLAAEGMPIRGDLKYGAHRSTGNGLIMLHARNLKVDLGKGGTIEATAPTPDDEPLWKVFSQN